jgi:hypothetical protein
MLYLIYPLHAGFFAEGDVLLSCDEELVGLLDIPGKIAISGLEGA